VSLLDHIRELVRKAQKNDLGAFEELVHLYQDRVYGLCYQLTNNHADAQDLAQEVFIRAYTGLGSFRNEADFGTWLHRIAVNQGININKKQKKNNAISLDAPFKTAEGEMLREIAATGEDPQEVYEQVEMQKSVRTALDQLSQEHRSILVLREMQGYSYEEIAAIVGCSLGTVKSRINRARQALKEMFSGLTC
jgi:RNA polymerase sigma-70 factor (ECF subfamily)